MLEANIHNDTAPTFYHGRTVIGAAAVAAITPTLPTIVKGVLCKAGNGNAGTVYVGKAGVTDATAVATDGYPLLKNEEVFIKADDASLIYAIASGAAHDLHWLAI
jgi:hypothetical protein